MEEFFNCGQCFLEQFCTRVHRDFQQSMPQSIFCTWRFKELKYQHELCICACRLRLSTAVLATSNSIQFTNSMYLRFFFLCFYLLQVLDLEITQYHFVLKLFILFNKKESGIFQLNLALMMLKQEHGVFIIQITDKLFLQVFFSCAVFLTWFYLKVQIIVITICRSVSIFSTALIGCL